MRALYRCKILSTKDLDAKYSSERTYGYFLSIPQEIRHVFPQNPSDKRVTGSQREKRRFDLEQSLKTIVRQGGEMIGKDGGSRRGSIPGPQRRGTQGTRLSSLSRVSQCFALSNLEWVHLQAVSDLEVQLLKKRFNRQFVVSCDVLEDAGKHTCLEGRMVRDYFVVFAVKLSRHADMGAGLASGGVAQDRECPD
jgi:hypothetical protein